MIAAASRWCSRSSRVARESSWSRSTASRRSPIRLRPARARCPTRRRNAATVALRGSAAARHLRGRGGELAFGKARPARGAYCAHVDDEIDLGLLQGVDHGLRRGVLVADGEKRFHDKRVDKRGSAAWLVAASCCGFCHGIPKPCLRSPTRPPRGVAFYVTIPAIAATLRKPQPKLPPNHIGPHRFFRL